MQTQFVSKIKTNIQLFSSLSAEEREKAYRVMGFIYMPNYYTHQHSVDADAAMQIVQLGYGIILGYSTIMH